MPASLWLYLVPQPTRRRGNSERDGARLPGDYEALARRHLNLGFLLIQVRWNAAVVCGSRSLARVVCNFAFVLLCEPRTS